MVKSFGVGVGIGIDIGIGIGICTCLEVNPRTAETMAWLLFTEIERTKEGRK